MEPSNNGLRLCVSSEAQICQNSDHLNSRYFDYNNVEYKLTNPEEGVCVEGTYPIKEEDDEFEEEGAEGTEPEYFKGCENNFDCLD